MLLRRYSLEGKFYVLSIITNFGRNQVGSTGIATK